MATTAPIFDPTAVRTDFPILQTQLAGAQPLVYLDNAASTQRPRPVVQAMVEMEEKFYANVHRGIHWLSEESTDRYERARETVRAFVGAASSDEIIFTSGTTAAINLVARSWGDARLGAGDEVLVSVMEHHSNLVPWQQLAERTGAVLRAIGLTGDGRLALDQFDQCLSERTKLVAVTAVSNVLGTINDVRQIAAKAHDAGAIVLVDGAQHVPHAPLDVRALGADFLAFSGHKMLGPTGIGVLYGRRELLDAMPPFLGGGGMIHDVKIDRFTPAELPGKFEAGTPPIVPAIGLAAAIDYLSDVGLETIGQHERRLTRHAHGLLGDIEGVRLLGPEPAHKAGIVSFTVDRIHAHDVAQFLNDHHGVAVRAGHHCTQPLHESLGITASTRASFYFYNTVAEVQVLAESLQGVQSFFHRRRKRKGEGRRRQ